MEFLSEDVKSWDTDASYQHSKAIVKRQNVVNDGVERGVKLSTDFAQDAKSENHFQNLLQTVEDNRKQVPDLRNPKKLKGM